MHYQADRRLNEAYLSTQQETLTREVRHVFAKQTGFATKLWHYRYEVRAYAPILPLMVVYVLAKGVQRYRFLR